MNNIIYCFFFLLITIRKDFWFIMTSVSMSCPTFRSARYCEHALSQSNIDGFYSQLQETEKTIAGHPTSLN